MNTQHNIQKPLMIVGIITLILLMVPLIAMQFTTEVNWSISDFIIMAALIFGTGSAYVLISRLVNNGIYKLATAVSLGTVFFMIWSNLAVGLIGAGPHAGNLLYIAVIAVFITGSFITRFSAHGMERTMYATAGALVLHTVIALLADMDEYPAASINEIFSVNGFFASLFAIAGLLFRLASKTKRTANS